MGSRKTTILKASRRYVVVSRGVVLEALLLFLSTTTGAPILGFAEQVYAADVESNVNNNNVVAANMPQETELFKGRITLAPSVDITNPHPNAALYITCRPDKLDSVPLALLNAYRGKAPPVLSVRLPNPTFPMDFVLKFPNDLTLEGGWDERSPLSSTTDDNNNGLPPPPPPMPPPRTIDDLWWNKVDLIVSARWDSDGVAATRSPDDLVGRGLWKFNEKSQESLVEIQMTGRGAFGKFATGTGTKK